MSNIKVISVYLLGQVKDADRQEKGQTEEIQDALCHLIYEHKDEDISNMV